MKKEENLKVLVYDDEKNALKSLLVLNGFNVCQLKNVKDSIDIIRKFKPDIMIFSYSKLKNKNLIEEIREDIGLSHTPIMVITNKYDIKNAIKELNGNVDDYIVKPFLSEELLARISRILNRHKIALNANPLTKLPGNDSIKMEIQRRLDKKDGFCVCYADLDNFKAFNDYYGYEKGDIAIKITGEVIASVLEKYDEGKRKNFLGHIGGDDFIFISDIENVRQICEEIIKEFDKKILSLYETKDLENGWIISYDRNGNKKIFPIMTLSISVVINHKGESRHIGEISKIGAELKTFIKKKEGSNFIIDRRKRSIISVKNQYPSGKRITFFGSPKRDSRF